MNARESMALVVVGSILLCVGIFGVFYPATGRFRAMEGGE